jgi:hypothetical protein
MSRPPRAPAPQQVPLIGSLDQKLATLSQAISAKSDVTLEPTYAAVLLMSPDGSTWRVTISATGALQTAQVPRT